MPTRWPARSPSRSTPKEPRRASWPAVAACSPGRRRLSSNTRRARSSRWAASRRRSPASRRSITRPAPSFPATAMRRWTGSPSTPSPLAFARSPRARGPTTITRSMRANREQAGSPRRPSDRGAHPFLEPVQPALDATAVDARVPMAAAGAAIDDEGAAPRAVGEAPGADVVDEAEDGARLGRLDAQAVVGDGGDRRARLLLDDGAPHRREPGRGHGEIGRRGVRLGRGEVAGSHQPVIGALAAQGREVEKALPTRQRRRRAEAGERAKTAAHCVIRSQPRREVTQAPARGGTGAEARGESGEALARRPAGAAPAGGIEEEGPAPGEAAAQRRGVEPGFFGVQVEGLAVVHGLRT